MLRQREHLVSGIMVAVASALGFAYTAIAGSVTGAAGAGVNAGGTLDVNSAGTWQLTRTGSSGTPSPSGLQNWIAPVVGTPGDTHWVRASITSGTVTTGTTGSWLALSSNRQWTKTAVNGDDSVTLTIAIATDSGGTNIVSSGSVTLGYAHV